MQSLWKFWFFGCENVSLYLVWEAKVTLLIWLAFPQILKIFPSVLFVLPCLFFNTPLITCFVL